MRKFQNNLLFVFRDQNPSMRKEFNDIQKENLSLAESNFRYKEWGVKYGTIENTLYRSNQKKMKINKR